LTFDLPSLVDTFLLREHCYPRQENKGSKRVSLHSRASPKADIPTLRVSKSAVLDLVERVLHRPVSKPAIRARLPPDNTASRPSFAIVVENPFATARKSTEPSHRTTRPSLTRAVHASARIPLDQRYHKRTTSTSIDTWLALLWADSIRLG
jgi:hypothetical protein